MQTLVSDSVINFLEFSTTCFAAVSAIDRARNYLYLPPSLSLSPRFSYWMEKKMEGGDLTPPLIVAADTRHNK